MPAARTNPQLFALRQPPPEEIELAGVRYRLLRVFKHDFLAATCLYESAAVGPAAKVVVKLPRSQGFCGVPLGWLGRLTRDHEEAVYRALRDVPGVPRFLGRVGPLGYAIEYVDGRPLDHPPLPPPGFFDRLRNVLDAVHARGVAYGDANKRSNILIGPDGQPYLIDYQIAFRRRDDWRWLGRTLSAAVVRYLAARDLYHLYKHKRRMCPGELAAEEEALSRQRPVLHRLHRLLTTPYRRIRRLLLRRAYQRGSLVSPTEPLEDHDQPEKRTWRTTEGRR